MDYTFEGYSSWSNIQDNEFQKMRSDYLYHKNRLKDYIKNKIEKLKDEIEELKDQADAGNE